ncbi:MAG: histidine phosphatase family protein [Anaerolineae bacterium]|jgi:broad specificity phosphatase PhoE
MIELVLARHGQSYGNLDRSFGPDSDLTDLGREQATRLANWLAEQDYGFTALYCSTLRRARQTAEIINGHFGLEIVFDADLREAAEPYVDSMPLRADPLGEELPPPFEPEYEALRKRVARVTARILSENPEGEILVVAHGGTLATMLRCILGTHALLLRTEQAAAHCLRWEDGRWNLQYANRQEHR